MGWEAGKGLGARGEGIVNAIQVNFGGQGQGQAVGGGHHGKGRVLGGGQGSAGDEEEEQPQRKKRPGLSDSLVLVRKIGKWSLFNVLFQGKKAKAFHNKVYKQ